VPSKALRARLMGQVRSLVVKVGTALLTGDDGRIDRALVGRLARQVAQLHHRGIRVTLVSSGAIGAGMGRVEMAGRPRSLPMLQATAAIGQPALMAIYEKAFARHGLHAGQILVTRADFEDRSRYVRVSNTIAALHKLNALPIINENDTVAVDELDRFADNDTIAALVTNLLRADLLVILTVVDGLLDPQGLRVDLVPRVSDVLSLAKKSRSTLGSGGMASKLAAARLVTEAGEGVVIANGRERSVLIRLLEGARIGTIFAPSGKKKTARKRWLLSAVRPVGRVVIDDGAVNAVRAQGKSLLARGIAEVGGKFGRGAVVAIATSAGQTIAHGVSNYSHAELRLIKGLKSAEIAEHIGEKPFDEVVHRDNLVLTVEGS